HGSRRHSCATSGREIHRRHGRFGRQKAGVASAFRRIVPAGFVAKFGAEGLRTFEGGEQSMRRVLTAVTLGGGILFAASAFAPTAPATAPTFSKDIAPIFQSKCQACHQPNSIAPMSLITFADSRPWAKSIKQRVAQRQ